MNYKEDIHELSQKTLQMLALEMVDNAQSGHPGIVLSASSILYALFHDHLIVNFKKNDWFNRDRFVFSAGHGSALLYSMIFLVSDKLKINDLKNFRQLNSKTPGHLEKDEKVGVEVTTGPLGQGIGMGVGLAFGEKYLSQNYNSDSFNFCDHYTYVLAGDGDLQEGVSQEAISLAGKYQLNKLILLYDSNKIQLDSNVETVSIDNVKLKFEACGWNYLYVKEGHEWKKVSEAISYSKQNKKPTIIEINTIIGRGTSVEASPQAHGAPLSKDDLQLLRKKWDWNYQPFYYPEKVKIYLQKVVYERSVVFFQSWNKEKNQLEKQNDYDWKYFLSQSEQFLKESDFKEIIPINEEATRISSSKILEILSDKIVNLIGGSADLSCSTKTIIKDKNILFSKSKSEIFLSKHIFFGVREFAMGTIINGLLLHGFRAFASTFLVFSDYMRASIRLAALMKLPSTYIFTHDSVALGEDGPTHQPIEHLWSLRMIPGVILMRPADFKETLASYFFVLKSQEQPAIIILTRQNVKQLTSTSVINCQKGAYIIKEENKSSKLEMIIAASGSELSLALEVGEYFSKKLNIRVVSFFSTNLFDQQEKFYQEEIFPLDIPKVMIELGSTTGWYKYFSFKNDLVIGIDCFGKSGKYKDILEYFSFTKEKIIKKINKFIW